MSKIPSASCPSCSEIIEFEDYYEAGELIFCDNCGIELKITSTRPPKLKVVKIAEGLQEEEEEDEDLVSDLYNNSDEDEDDL